jgi:hypothetical protein
LRDVRLIHCRPPCNVEISDPAGTLCADTLARKRQTARKNRTRTIRFLAI